jgi:CRISPR system Cascade subunit CasC
VFIQIHTLASYPSSLLNRDDVGLSKRVPFGGVTRTRVSSQCLKRHWRTFDGEHSILAIQDQDHGGVVPMAVRSRRIFENEIRIPLELSGVDPGIARDVTEALMSIVLGESVKKTSKEKQKINDNGNGGNGEKESEEKKDPGAYEKIETNQVVCLGRPEIEFLRKEAMALAKKVRSKDDLRALVKGHFSKENIKNLQSLRHGAGLDAALFGRMVTSDILARCDAAIHVAHALTVHAQACESDYFTVVDDLFSSSDDNQLGSGHLGTAELTSGLFYQYVVVDVAQLVTNIEGCPRTKWKDANVSLTEEVIRRLVQLIARVSPGAKVGSTAPYAYAQMMLIEKGISQPRTLANAFLLPVDERPDLLRNTYNSMVHYLMESDSLYGNTNSRRFVAMRPTSELHNVATQDERGLEGLSRWAASTSEDPS